MKGENINLTDRSSMSQQDSSMRQRIRQALMTQRTPTVTVLSSLLAVQDALSYLPNEAMEETSSFIGASVNDVWAVASFYTNFRSTPPARHTIEICWGPSCHMTGAPALLQNSLGALGLSGEDDTNDGNVTLKYNTCLGACSQAPAISVDHKIIGRMESKRLLDLISDLYSSGSTG
jgi:formate dehydrogenase subunit gamma